MALIDPFAHIDLGAALAVSAEITCAADIAPARAALEEAEAEAAAMADPGVLAWLAAAAVEAAQ